MVGPEELELEEWESLADAELLALPWRAKVALASLGLTSCEAVSKTTESRLILRAGRRTRDAIRQAVAKWYASNGMPASSRARRKQADRLLRAVSIWGAMAAAIAKHDRMTWQDNGEPDVGSQPLWFERAPGLYHVAAGGTLHRVT